jgi:Xaa-Pro aminopeptidase
MAEAYPMLSLNERERRWKRTRELMKQKGLECLVVFGKGREHFDAYLTNEIFDGIVVFPLVGEPIYLLWAPNRVLVRLETALKDEKWWVADLRSGSTGPGVVGAMQEVGMDRATIGVVGLDHNGPGEVEGIVPYKTWAYVLQKLPHATLVDVSLAYSEMMMIKSDEELNLIRHSAEIGERACETMMNVTKVGVPETEIFSAVMSTIYSHGAVSTPTVLILKSGPNNVSWGAPIWVHRGGSPRVMQKGDIVNAEIFPIYGGFETQQQMAVALKPIDPVNQRCADIARRSYEAGLKALRPGKSFKEVCDAMDRPLLEAGAWNLSPLIHTLMPLAWVGPQRFDPSQLPEMKKYKGVSTVEMVGDLMIKPGMIFELEPNASFGKNRVNIGGTVIVTKDGVEVLNTLPMEMRVVA